MVILTSQGSCPLLQGIFYLATTLRLGQIDERRILVGIQIITDAVEGLVSQNDCSSTGRSEANGFKPLEEVTMVFARAYPVLLRAVNALFGSTDRVQPSFGVTEIVRLFQAFLGRLHRSSIDELVRQQTGAKNRKKAIRTKTAESNHGNNDDIPASNHDRHSKDLVRVLVGMITTLDMTHPSHVGVLNGLMCSLLDHIGSSLSLLVFADTDLSPKEKGGICPPQGLLHVAHLKSQDALDIAKLEGPWLIKILRAAVTYLYANAEVMSNDSLAQFLPLNWHQPKASSLQEGLKQILQHTLLRGVFGDDDEAFKDSALRRVEADKGTDPVESTSLREEQQDPADLFIAQLWEILGWSILSSKRCT